MNISINRNNIIFSYQTKEINLLKALFDIKSNQEQSLTFRAGCRSGDQVIFVCLLYLF